MKAVQIYDNEQALFNIPVPVRTTTYSPVSHKDVITRIHEEADKNNFVLKSTKYHAARDGRQIIGYMDYLGDNEEFGMRVGFRNSYDKTMSFALAVGNTVWICGNGCVSGEINTRKIHRGSELTGIIDDKIVHGFELAHDVYMKNIQAADRFKEVEIDMTTINTLTGKLFLESNIINGMQLNVLKNELEGSKNFKTMFEPGFTTWDYYNNVTESLKLSHPNSYFQDHINFHNFMLETV